MNMPYLGSPLPLANMQNPDYLNAMPGIDLPDQRSNFDPETFVSGDDIAFSQHNLPSNLKRFPSNYEDPFTDMVAPFEAPPQEQSGDSSIEHNNKLLSFSMPAYNFTLLDFSLRRTSLSLSAQLHGMFFLAESPWTTSPNENAPPQQGAELTCYRRNLFQITGSVTLPRGLRYIMTEQGDRIPILAQELTVSATESVEGNTVKIISVPWKTPAANGNPAGDDTTAKVEKEPPPVPLDIMAGQDLDTDYATFPIAWKRLQFRVATANNGRRKELQQHFVVRLRVVATLSTGAKIPISEVRSGPVIVRGRSPRNFQSRKDLPLSGSAAASRKNAQASVSSAVNRTPTNESAPSAATPAKGKSRNKSSSPEAAVPQPNGLPQNASPDWPIQSTLDSPALHRGSLYQSSPEFSRPAEPQRRSSNIAAPIHLSLFDDDDANTSTNDHVLNHLIEPSKTNPSFTDVTKNALNMDTPNSTAPPSKMRKLSHSVSQSSARNNSTSRPLLNNTTSTSNIQQPFASSLPFPNESADLLYEYFPLGLDDWQAPVDAVYRPHVVHHTNMPGMKLMASRNRNKRYFAAEDVY